jgi:hypothetical protein
VEPFAWPRVPLLPEPFILLSILLEYDLLCNELIKNLFMSSRIGTVE